MQKKLLAVAVLATLSGAAVAQSANVTVYGRFKQNLEYLNMTGASNPAAGNAGAAGALNGPGTGNNDVKLSRMQQSSSLIGFRGTEDLGNGLRAEFQIETDAGGDEQNSGSGTFANRDTFIGIGSNTWGTVRMGHFDTYFTTAGRYYESAASYGWSLMHDPLNMLNRSQSGVQTTFHSGNAIRYISPNWSGFQIVGQVSPNAFGQERKQAGSAVGGAFANSRQWMIDLSYANGPLAAGLSYIRTANGVNSPALYSITNGVLALPGNTSGLNLSALTCAGPAASGCFNNYSISGGTRVGVSYIFGMGVRVGFIYDRLTDTAAAAPTAAAVLLGASQNHTRTAWALPISWKSGPHTVAGQYSRAGSTSGVANTVVAGVGTFGDTKSYSYSLAYDYAFSKRSSIGVQYSAIINGDNASYDAWSRGIGSTSSAGAVAGGQDPKMFSVGLRHVF